jgi:hypothetical protein
VHTVKETLSSSCGCNQYKEAVLLGSTTIGDPNTFYNYKQDDINKNKINNIKKCKETRVSARVSLKIILVQQ